MVVLAAFRAQERRIVDLSLNLLEGDADMTGVDVCPKDFHGFVV